MKTFMHETVQQLPSNLNGVLSAAYVKEVNEYNTSMSKLLKDGFGMSGEEVFNFLSTGEQNVNLFCCTELKSMFNNLANQYLLRKFSLGFKRDEKGNNRNWKEIEEPKIKDMFEVNKKLVEDSID